MIGPPQPTIETMAELGHVRIIKTTLESCFHRLNCVNPFDNERVLITEGVHFCSLVHLQTGESIQTWSFPRLNPLTSPVVYDPTREKLVAVQNGNILRVFGRDEEISSVRKVKLPKSIWCVVARTDREPLLVHENGSLSSLTELLEKSGDEKDNITGAGEVIKWASIKYLKSKTAELFLLTELEGVRNVLYRLEYHVKKSLILRLDDTSRTCLKHQLEHMTLSPDGTVFALEKNSHQIIRVSRTGEESVTPADLDIEQCYGLIMIGTKSFAFTAKTKHAYKLCIFNLTYQLITTEIVFDISPLNYKLITVQDNLLCIPCNMALLLIPFEETEITLASIVRKNALRKQQELESSEANDDMSSIRAKLKSSFPKETERLLVKALRLSASQETDEEDTNDILSKPFNDQFIVDELKKQSIEIDELVRLMKFLNCHIFNLNEFYVIEWLCAVFDAYFKMIVIRPRKEVVSVLEEINDKLENLCKFHEQMQSLKHLINAVDLAIGSGRKIEPTARIIGPYTVEMLYL